MRRYLGRMLSTLALAGLLASCGEPAAPRTAEGSPAAVSQAPASPTTAQLPAPASPGTPVPAQVAPTPGASPAAAAPAPTSETTPYPYTTPLPALETTPIDGSYTKIDPRLGTPTPCRRCPDYAREGGLWRLQFDRGIYRISAQANGWRSVGSFTVSGNRLVIFNDPTCHLELGVYTWQLQGAVLSLQVVEDPCAIRLRAANLTQQPWTRAQP